MSSQLLSACAATALLIVISIFIVRSRTSIARTPEAPNNFPELTSLSERLLAALPESIILPHDSIAFRRSMNAYWARQETEVVPACVVRPKDVEQLCTAVTILRNEFDDRRKNASHEQFEGLFAIRSGGHSPVPNAASINGGALIDLSLICEVTPSDDGSSVVIGAGAKWTDVSKILDERSLAVAGGRNSEVGLGGLTLGGGISFFTPRFGFVCSNIISYKIVLASGEATIASASHNSDLWRALKGGSNNFGIVTHFTARSFPSTKIWSGFLYMLPSQATKVLTTFHESVKRKVANDSGATCDVYAAGPIACFSYIQQLGMQVVSVSLVYTKEPEIEGKWPAYWKTSPFSSLWRVWSTCKVRALTNATDEMSSLNPPGRRQVFATTTIKNDPATIKGVHAVYQDAISSLHRCKGLVWTLVLQPLLPEWARKGDPNPLGLNEGPDEPLVLVSFTVNWNEDADDDLIQTMTRKATEKMDKIAEANGTAHRFRFLNYCAMWQKPFEGYGEENLQFLRSVSRKYDPEGLFQRGCVGGFKLGIEEGK